MRLIKVFGCLALLLGLAACDDNDSNSKADKQSGEFDRQAMLTNIGQNVILPNYQDFKTKTRTLQKGIESFVTEPNVSNLEEARSAFNAAYQSWQRVTPYNFGPAKQMALRSNLNTFPTDGDAIESRIQQNEYQWGPYDNDTKGFPALDYLLYKEQGNETIVESFKDSDRGQYLAAVADDIAKQSQKVYNRWQSADGNYIETFINATGNDKGSSLALMVNQLNFDFEIIKDEKLGIPAGKKSMGEIFPKKVEAYYSQESLPLLKANLNAIENLFMGRYEGNDKLGLDDHLDALNAERDGKLLSQVINNQFSKIRENLENIPQPMPSAIKDKHEKVNASFRAIKRQVVFIKTDMPSALGVRITYQDNDGD